MVNYLKNINAEQIKQLNTVSPYKLLNLDSNSSSEDLKSKFKELVNIVHPDRGGNKELFNILFKSYKEIENNIKMRDNIKSQEELKTTFKSDCEDILNGQNKIKFELNKFNKVFDDNNNVNNTQSGHGDFLKTGETVHVDNNIKNPIIEYKIPESYNNSSYGCNLLYSDTKNFSDNGQYCDIKQAYTSSNNSDTSKIDNSMYNRDLKSLEDERSNIKMSENDQNKYEEYERHLKNQEENFYQNLVKKDKNISKNYNNFNRKMINM